MIVLDPSSPFAVVVPLFDGVQHIHRALACVAAQTQPPREVVVVDDGSTDGGGELAASDPAVRVIRQENRGIGPTKNRGIEATAAPWIALMDQDDHWFPDHLEELERLIVEFPSAGLVASTSREVGLDRLPDALLRRRRAAARRRAIDYLRRAGRDIGVVHTSAAAIRREAHAAVGGFADRSGPDDIDLWARIALDHPVALSTRSTSLWVRGTGGLMERTRSQGDAELESDDWAPLDELSTSVRSVASALREGRHVAPRRSLELYIDGRSTAGWRGVLLTGAQRRARRRWRELRHPFHWSAWPFLIAAWMPTPMGRWLATTRRAIVTRLPARPQ